MLYIWSMLKLYPDNLSTVIIMSSTLLQCSIVIVMQIKLTVVVVCGVSGTYTIPVNDTYIDRKTRCCGTDHYMIRHFISQRQYAFLPGLRSPL